MRDPVTRKVVTPEPLNAATPLERLDGRPTPPAARYVRNHFPMPVVGEADWSLRVEGAVAKPLELSLAELRNRSSREVTVTLECAGNGRIRMSPTPGGTPWDLGAVTVTRFRGTPLAALLEEARADFGAREALFIGADRGEVEGGRVVPFARSLPLERCRSPEVLLAWEADGEPLPREHGRPLRLVVPGWYAMASVKWLERIELLEKPFEGYFQRERYVYLGEEGTPDGTPVRTIRVRSLFAHPLDGQELPPEPTELRGTAWSGSGGITRVEVSTDGGASWSEARLGSPGGDFAPTPWEATWSPERTGPHELVVRATDVAGHVQPLEPRWNRLGYGNNPVQRIEVTVV